MTHLLIQMSELLGEADEVDDCLCGGGLGVHVEGRDWAVVQLHLEGCAPSARPALRLVGPSSPAPTGGAA